MGEREGREHKALDSAVHEGEERRFQRCEGIAVAECEVLMSHVSC